MGFLDNSGDIILDAVLTDAGRARLAKGDGSFKISKFALGDDEINYGLYSATPSSNKIPSTPIFEAFTNNIASLNSRLISISRTNLMYLPVLKLNNKFDPNNEFCVVNSLVQNGFVLAVDDLTEKMFANATLTFDSSPVGTKGILNGNSINGGASIRIDQGVDNELHPVTNEIDQDLNENQFLLEVDNRFASLINVLGESKNYSYVDDDSVAAYYVSFGDNITFVDRNSDKTQSDRQVIRGSRGTILTFKLKSSADVSSSKYLFDKMGVDVTSNFKINTTDPAGTNIKKISTSIRVTGLTTGYAIDVPLVLIKKIS